VTVSQRPAVAAAPAVVSPGPPGEVMLARLPPLEQFTAMVERPLFSASRRPAVASEPEVAEEELPDPEPVPEASGLPEVRFVGTIRQGGAMTALVVPEGHDAAVKLRVGDEVAGWRVRSVGASQLVLEHEGERRVLTILE
jgi:Tfp pilus assembly protein PilP